MNAEPTPAQPPQRPEVSCPASPPWHQDCLVVATLLAACLSPTEMKRLLPGQPSSGPGETDPPPVEQADLLLSRRFADAQRRLAGKNSAEAWREFSPMPWPVPGLWACCSSGQEGLRAVGRRLAHMLLARGVKGLRESAELPQLRERARRLSEARLRPRRSWSACA